MSRSRGRKANDGREKNRVSTLRYVRHCPVLKYKTRALRVYTKARTLRIHVNKRKYALNIERKHVLFVLTRKHVHFVSIEYNCIGYWQNHVHCVLAKMHMHSALAQKTLAYYVNRMWLRTRFKSRTTNCDGLVVWLSVAIVCSAYTKQNSKIIITL